MAKKDSKDKSGGKALKKLRETARIDFEAVLTSKDVEESEKIAQEIGISRRITLAMLARSKTELLDGFNRVEISEDGLFQWIDCITGFKEHLSELLELAKSAESRAIVLASAIALAQEEKRVIA